MCDMPRGKVMADQQLTVTLPLEVWDSLIVALWSAEHTTWGETDYRFIRPTVERLARTYRQAAMLSDDYEPLEDRPEAAND